MLVSSPIDVATRVNKRPLLLHLRRHVSPDAFRLIGPSAPTWRGHASAEGRRGAAARPAAVRGAGAVLHQPLERLHGGAALPCVHTVGPARVLALFQNVSGRAWVDMVDMSCCAKCVTQMDDLHLGCLLQEFSSPFLDANNNNVCFRLVRIWRDWRKSYLNSTVWMEWANKQFSKVMYAI